MSLKERFDLLEASHVRVMTELEMEVRKNDKAWRRHRRFVRDLDLSRKAEDARWAEHRVAHEDLDRRIAELVSGIGAFIAAQGGKTK